MQPDRLHPKRSPFIWRLLRKLPISQPRIEDALLGLFVVLLRRLRAFDNFQPLCDWIFATTYRVAYKCWRSSGHVEDRALSSAELAEQVAALHTAFEWLDCLDEDKRSVTANSHALAGRGPHYLQSVPFVDRIGHQPKRRSFRD